MPDKSKKKIDTSKYVAHYGGFGPWNSLMNLGDGMNHVTFAERKDLTPADAEKERKYLLDWYNNPATLDRVTALMGRIPESLNRGTFVNEHQRTYIQEEPDDMLERHGGAYSISGNKLFRDQNYVVFSPDAYDRDQLRVHELNHAYSDFHEDMFSRLPDRKYDPASYGVLNIPAISSSYPQPDIEYLQDPSEIHSRLMEIRHYLRKKPGEKIDGNELRKALDDLDGDNFYRQMRYYNDDALLYWLNTVADNNTWKPDVNIAAEGGDLNDMGIQDPSEIGVGGLKGLKGVDREQGEYSRLVQSGSPLTAEALSGNFRRRTFNTYINEPIDVSVGFTGVGDSRYDKEIETVSQLDNLSNTRGELQSGIVQLGSGLAKAGVLAGTTFLDGILGTIVGIGTAASEGRWSGLWDNRFSRVMNSINELSEEALPNYYTDKELEDPWYKNIFTANFIGDKVIKNLGFAVGAAYSGRVGAGVLSKVSGLNKVRNAFKGAVSASGEGFKSVNDALSAARSGENIFLNGVRITEALANDAKKLRYANPVLKLTGAFSGALGEARIEAIQNSNDWEETQIRNLTEAYNNVKQEEAARLMSERPDLFTYENDGNGGFVPVPTAQGSALIEGRASARFDYNGGLAKIQEDKLKMGNIDFLLNIPLLTLSDMWQFGKFYAGGYKAARKTAGLTRKVIDGKVVYEPHKAGIAETVGRTLQKSIAEGPFEEMGQSAISRGAGYKYGSELNSFYGAKIDPVSEEESVGFIKAMGDAILDTYGNVENYEEGFIGAMTAALGIPTIRTTERGIRPGLEGGVREDIREMQAENRRNREVADALNKRIQSPEFLNYYQGMVRHNKYQRDMDRAAEEGDAFEFKNAEHSQLISDVMMFEDAGRIQDFYDILEEAGTISDSDIESLREITDDGTDASRYRNMTDSEIRESVRKEVEDTRKKADSYRKIASDLMTKAGTEFSSDELKELTWMMTRIDDWEKRFTEMYSSFRTGLSTAAEIAKSTGNTGAYDDIQELSSKSPMEALVTLAENDKISESLLSMAELAGPSSIGILEDVNDMVKMAKARNTFLARYNSYLQDPDSLRKMMSEEEEKAVEDKKQMDTETVMEEAGKAETPSDLEEALSNAPTEEIRTEVEKQLRKEGNPVITEKDKKENLTEDVSSIIDNLSPDENIRNKARIIFDRMVQSEATADEILDPDNTSYKEGLEDDDNIEAAFIVEEALRRERENNDIKDRMSVTEEDINPAGHEEEVVEEPEMPVGVTSKESMDNENSFSATEGLPEGSYYAPAISEFSINGQRIGDFTPFGDTIEGKKYKPLYDFLVRKGAFDYVNQGKLKKGDRVHFLISKEFNEIAAENPDFNSTTIFMAVLNNDGSYQIVGSLPAREISDRYEGLSELEDRIIESYNKGKGDYISSESISVSKIMVGRVPTGIEEKNLSDIPYVDPSNAAFGVVKQGALLVPNKSGMVLAGFSTEGRNANLYLMLPDGAGKYRPVNVRVRYLSEYDINDVTKQNTPVYKDLIKGLTALAEARNQDDMFKAKKMLENVLYLGGVSFYPEVRGSESFIKIVKVPVDAGGTPIEGGQKVENYIHTGSLPALLTLGSGGSSSPSTPPPSRPREDVVRDIVAALQDMNVPFQVSHRLLNSRGYNKRIIDSGIVTSNILEARFRGTWFTTDYFSPEGTEKNSVPPAEGKAGARESNSVGGIEVDLRGDKFYVDGSTVRDKNGRIVKSPDPVLQAEAYALQVYGDAMNGSGQINGVVLLPSGDLYNRKSRKIIHPGDDGYSNLKKQFDPPVKTDNNTIIADIEENQRKVDRVNSTGDTYSIMEEDGQYHEYKSVRSVMGGLWTENPKVHDTISAVSASLAEKSSQPEQYNRYLDFLKGKYGIDLTEYKGRTTSQDRDIILSLLRESLSEANPPVKASDPFRLITRNFFMGREVVKPDNVSEEAFQSYLSSLGNIRNSLNEAGETVISSGIVVFRKYDDGSRIAGEADIIAVDRKGNIKMYDIKAGKYSFHPFMDRYGRTVDYFTSKHRLQTMSLSEYTGRQMSILKDLFDSQYSTPVSSMGLLPVVVEYNDSIISSVSLEKGIPVKYTPYIPSPVQDKPVNNDAVFNSSLETGNPENLAIENNRLEGSVIGYYTRKDKLYKNYLKLIGSVNGVKVYLVKEARMSRGFDKKAEPKEIGAYYRVVFGNNGATLNLIPNDLTVSVTVSPEQAMRLVESSPDIVKEVSSRNTIISSFTTGGESKSSRSNKDMKSIRTTLKRRPMTRLADSNQAKADLRSEISWLNTVLPQMSEEGRLRVQEGLINVAEGGAEAWGVYDEGVIRLSNIAAEGTVYHEAFHAVMDLMASEKEKNNLMNEARQKWGDLTDTELEERMAEEFREYVMGVRKKGLGRRILDFFSKLLDIVTNWRNIRPYTYSFYNKINSGGFSSASINPLSRPGTDLSLGSLKGGIRDMLEAKGWKKEIWDAMTYEEKQHAVRCASI